MSDTTRFSLPALTELAHNALIANGAPAEVARIVADILVEADARGIASHGVARLPNYIERMNRGLVDAHAEPEVVHNLGGLAVIDGHNGFGAHAALEATNTAAERAADQGVAWVSVRNSNHFGLAAAYTGRLARRGFAAICLSSAPPAMAAFGGKRPVLGTNPISMAIPGANAPVILDMATTIVARGKIRQAARRDEPIASGLALDAEGTPTTDPHTALAGTLAPVGGPKGYGLALMIDLMSGLFAGGSSSTELGESTDFSRTAGTCFTIIAASTAHLSGELGARAAAIAELIRASADDPASIRLPGEIEQQASETAAKDGVAIASTLADELKKLANAGG